MARAQPQREPWPASAKAQVIAAALGNPVLAGAGVVGGLVGAAALAARSGRSFNPVSQASRALKGALVDIAAAGRPTTDVKVEGDKFDAPAYQAPTFNAPSFAAPSFAAPTFQAPIFQAPSFAAPIFQAPTFQAPSFAAPTFNAPSYQAPTFNGPASAGAPPAEAPPQQTRPAAQPPGTAFIDGASNPSGYKAALALGFDPSAFPVSRLDALSAKAREIEQEAARSADAARASAELERERAQLSGQPWVPATGGLVTGAGVVPWNAAPLAPVPPAAPPRIYVPLTGSLPQKAGQIIGDVVVNEGAAGLGFLYGGLNAGLSIPGDALQLLGGFTQKVGPFGTGEQSGAGVAGIGRGWNDFVNRLLPAQPFTGGLSNPFNVGAAIPEAPLRWSIEG